MCGTYGTCACMAYCHCQYMALKSKFSKKGKGRIKGDLIPWKYKMRGLLENQYFQVFYSSFQDIHLSLSLGTPLLLHVFVHFLMYIYKNICKYVEYPNKWKYMQIPYWSCCCLRMESLPSANIRQHKLDQQRKLIEVRPKKYIYRISYNSIKNTNKHQRKLLIEIRLKYVKNKSIRDGGISPWH